MGYYGLGSIVCGCQKRTKGDFTASVKTLSAFIKDISLMGTCFLPGRLL